MSKPRPRAPLTRGTAEYYAYRSAEIRRANRRSDVLWLSAALLVAAAVTFAILWAASEDAGNPEDQAPILHTVVLVNGTPVLI